MAITPKQIIGAAADLGRGAVNLLRRGRTTTRAAPPSGAPSSVGAPGPGEPRGVKSATAPRSRPKAQPAAPRKKEPTSKSGEF
jgi:hypothetical protein